MGLRHVDPLFAPVLFADRTEAGQRLAAVVGQRPGLDLELVLAIPRGGVPVAAPVAERLGLPLGVLVARKVGVPGHPELALGAVTRFGAVWNQDFLDVLRIPDAQLDAARCEALAEVERRERRYREGADPLLVAGQRLALVDDGLATGATMAAAVQAAHAAGAALVVVAVAVTSSDAEQRMLRLGAQVVSVAVPRDFVGVAQFFQDFREVSDEECIAILRRCRDRRRGTGLAAEIGSPTDVHEGTQR